ncbi:hypothetical protein [Fangia hongkongensis]|uniref:hypothetical protein n=1 Tax=Fangia hongkongensis TaxID=270495 RepID=UPI00035DD82B|nr:hypothetical protein [Fangia hongkongensis]MBK2124983.1 hypothetical protein [Fangia hongkongensis]
MIKIAGRHKSVPRELKRALTHYLASDTKVVMNDICSCRHAYASGYLKVIHEDGLRVKLRGYYGSGIVNFFVIFSTDEAKNSAISKIKGAFD